MRPQTQGKIERWHHSWDTRPDTTPPTSGLANADRSLKPSRDKPPALGNCKS